MARFAYGISMVFKVAVLAKLSGAVRGWYEDSIKPPSRYFHALPLKQHHFQNAIISLPECFYYPTIAQALRKSFCSLTLQHLQALAWCPWQPSLLATGGGRLDRQICFWNSVNGNLLSSHQTSSQVTGLLWSPHYREIISSHGYATATVADTTADAEELGNHLTLWKYPTMTRIADMPHAHNARILHMATAPEGDTIATLAADENLKFWKTWSRDGGKIKKGKSDADYHMSSNGQASNIQNTHASGGASRCASELPDKSPEFLGRFGKMQIR